MLWAAAEPLYRHISQISLMHGLVSATVQIITAVVLVCAIGWRPSRPAPHRKARPLENSPLRGLCENRA
jgi:hypothetical protein